MHRKALLLGFLVLALPLPLRAQGVPHAPSDDPQLTAFVDEALAGNPDVAQADALAAAARNRPLAASALPDPTVAVGYENDGVSPSLGREPMTRLSFTATQAFPYPGKLRLAGQVASKEAERATAAAARTRLGIAAAVRRAYADLLLARESWLLLADQQKTWSEIEQVSRIRYGTGSGTQGEILRAQAELTRLRQSDSGLEAAERSAVVAINRLLFRPLDTPVETPARLAPPSPLPEAAALAALAQDASADLAEARLAQDESALALELSRRNKRPDFVASVGYMNRGSLPLMWQASVGVTVPLWSKRKQAKEVDEAALRRDAARASEASVRSRLLAATEARRIALARLSGEIRLDQSALLLQDQMAVDAALATYRTGTGTFLAALDALNTSFTDRQKALGRLADYRKTEADLYAFTLDSSGDATAVASSSPSARTAAAGGAGM